MKYRFAFAMLPGRPGAVVAPFSMPQPLEFRSLHEAREFSQHSADQEKMQAQQITISDEAGPVEVWIRGSNGFTSPSFPSPRSRCLVALMGVNGSEKRQFLKAHERGQIVLIGSHSSAVTGDDAKSSGPGERGRPGRLETKAASRKLKQMAPSCLASAST